ncbi:hypothetical protein [Sphingomonas sp.]|uniref:hypothetical protein n=1 Tax=Sphingomonas sp. TaxID=28214 RepID=UPI0031E18EA7
MKSNESSQQGRAALRAVDAGIVARMSATLEGQTDETLMPQFGISYNTWRKVRAGQPIRRSVADRLEQRVHQASR